MAGDFNGDTITEIGTFNNGIWKLNFYNDGTAIKTISFGGVGDAPVVGDFDGDGKYGIGVFNKNNRGLWKIDNDLDGKADLASSFGGVQTTFQL